MFAHLRQTLSERGAYCPQSWVLALALQQVQILGTGWAMHG